MSKMTHGGILLKTFSLASKTIRFCKLRRRKKKVNIIHSTFTSSRALPFHPPLPSLPLSLLTFQSHEAKQVRLYHSNRGVLNCQY